MVVIAGPPGSGKSTAFPASETGFESFNADDRSAALNGGSYLNLTEEIQWSDPKSAEVGLTRDGGCPAVRLPCGGMAFFRLNCA